METINGILYINIESRKDRLKNINEQIYSSKISKEVPITKDIVQRIDAIINKNGAIGCAQSHIKALNIAIDNNWNRVMILEDDFAWKNESDYIIKCLKSIDSLDFHWDMILLSTPKNGLQIIKHENNYNLQRVSNAQTTTGYIVNGKDYMIKIRNCFQNCVEKLSSGKKANEFAIDISWKQFQLKDYWFYFKGNLGRQINSYSDIEKRQTTYSNATF